MINDGQFPIPPRYRWLRRWIALSAIVLLTLAALRLWWGAHAQARLERAIASLRASGQPVTLDDLTDEAVADDVNGATFLKAAFNQLRPPADPLLTYDNLMRQPGLVRRIAASLATHLDENSEVFVLARQARESPITQWGVRLAKPSANGFLAQLPRQRDVARMLLKKALFDHDRGAHDEAIETVFDMLSLSRRLHERGGFVVGHAWACTLADTACRALEIITPTFASERSTSGAPVHSAQRRRVIELIDALLDETGSRAGFRRALLLERAYELDVAEQAAQGQVANVGVPLFGIERWLFAPMFREDAARMLLFTSIQANAVEAVRLPQALALLPRYPRLESSVERFARQLSWTHLVISDRPFEIYFQAVARQRMAAVALAIRLHELEHGARPEHLEQIDTALLKRQPQDPLASVERALGYEPLADPPRLVCVDDTSIDEATSNRRPREVTHSLNGPWRQPASSQAQEDHLKVVP